MMPSKPNYTSPKGPASVRVNSLLFVCDSTWKKPVRHDWIGPSKKTERPKWFSCVFFFNLFIESSFHSTNIYCVPTVYQILCLALDMPR